MNAVGIDVSKGKSMVSVLRPFGEMVISPFEVKHNQNELNELVKCLKSLNGETKVIMECTANYHLPISYHLQKSGFIVCAVHAKLIHNFDNNSIRKVKTDKADSLKIANYGLSRWLQLSEYVPNENTRHMLKAYSHQYNKYIKLRTSLKNNLISLLDQTFPNANEIFTSPPRSDNGHEKWIDLVGNYWHFQCVSLVSLNEFSERYRKWCKRFGYYFQQSKVESIYSEAMGHIGIMPKNNVTKLLIRQAVAQINSICENLAVIKREMIRLAQTLPEYSAVITFNGVGELLASQLMAEIGDIYRFHTKKSLVSFAGLDAPPYASGKFVSSKRHISKKGSPHLRKSLFQVMDGILKRSPEGDPIYQFIDRKRAEGKPYLLYMTAGSAKFLRIYYARVKELLDTHCSKHNLP